MSIKVGFVSDLGVSSEVVRRFYAENWKRKIALSDKSFYEWQFIKAPNNLGEDHCVIAYDDQKEIVLGVMGLNERTFFLNGEEKRGAELTTWIVSSEAQGTGVGARILQYIQLNFEVLIGMGISEMALPIYMRSGFRYLSKIPRFIKVLNFKKLDTHSTYNKLGAKLAQSWSADSPINYTVTEIDDKEYSDVFESVKLKYNFFTRNNTHRTWRYNEHPHFKYKQFLIKNLDGGNEDLAYISIREEDSLNEFKIIHIMDFFGSDDAMESGVNFLNNYAKKNDYDVIDFYCTSSNIYRFMLGDGWFSINDDNCFQFPHLFHPIEMRTPPTTSLIYWSKDDLRDLADISKLYITKQDADLDRPTMHTLKQ